MPVGLHHLRYFVAVAEEGNVSRLLSAFRQRYPAATLELTECNFSDPSAGLNSGDVDIAFIMPPITHNGK